ncbi:hypothetical protein HPB51_012230 [Rhipicephalus microplus]|uniref:Uncharacterized protein n=1 Tax=Rhipicephalus microplus TaxID=6941 RepID=A0A9J6E980_RHIMP|nr:hypothetical protein HPB51_012230 [Rhipicephalus microplus]
MQEETVGPADTSTPRPAGRGPGGFTARQSGPYTKEYTYQVPADDSKRPYSPTRGGGFSYSPPPVDAASGGQSTVANGFGPAAVTEQCARPRALPSPTLLPGPRVCPAGTRHPVAAPPALARQGRSPTGRSPTSPSASITTPLTTGQTATTTTPVSGKSLDSPSSESVRKQPGRVSGGAAAAAITDPYQEGRRHPPQGGGRGAFAGSEPFATGRKVGEAHLQQKVPCFVTQCVALRADCDVEASLDSHTVRSEVT